MAVEIFLKDSDWLRDVYTLFEIEIEHYLQASSNVILEGRITRKIVYKISVISKSQDFYERFLGCLRDFWGFFDTFLRDF